MTSIASLRLRLDKQETGDNPDAWGDRLNAVIDLLDEAIGGFREVAINGNVVLDAKNFTSDQARAAVLRLTGAGGFNLTIPSVEKMYFIDNRCAADVILKTSATPGGRVIAGSKRIAYCDGATVHTDTSAGNPPASDVTLDPVEGLASNNVQGAFAEVAPKADATFTGTHSVPSRTIVRAQGGADEGGKLRLAKAASGATFGGDAAVVDVYRDFLRFFEGGGTNRGFKLDLTAGAAGADATLWHSGNFNPANKASTGVGESVTFGDVTAVRAGGLTGALYLNSAKDRWLHYNGTRYELNGAQLAINGSVAWHAGNFTPADYVKKDTAAVLTADPEIQKVDARLRLHAPGVIWWDLKARSSDGRLGIGTNTTPDLIAIGTGGDIFSERWGSAADRSLYNWIEKRANDFANLRSGEALTSANANTETRAAAYASAAEGRANTHANTAAANAAAARQAQIGTNHGFRSLRMMQIDSAYLLWGSVVVTLNSAGNAYVTFPQAFPSVCDLVVCCSGDYGVLAGKGVFSTTAEPQAAGFFLHVEEPKYNLDGQVVRVNFTAVGY